MLSHDEPRTTGIEPTRFCRVVDQQLIFSVEACLILLLVAFIHKYLENLVRFFLVLSK